jgi:hypothetical protein
VKSTDDVWERKRGTDDQIAQLFVAMARAAGMKAYVMAVTNRDRNLFLKAYLSFSQLDNIIAIVNVDGKDQFFDPGQRFCPYGHLAWKHTMVQGVRQTDNGSALAETPPESYKASRLQRVANLTMDEHGEVNGSVKMTWTGAPALKWRQSYLRGDVTSLQRDLRTMMEHLLPGGMDVKVSGIVDLDDYEKPLTVVYDVKGAIGSATGKRLLIPGDIFEANSRPTFAHQKRETPVAFDYPEEVQDAMRVNLPPSLGVESIPASAQVPLEKLAVYVFKTESTPTSVTVRRDFVLGDILFMPAEYPQLRTFYNQLETKDQEPIVLKVAAPAPAGD